MAFKVAEIELAESLKPIRGTERYDGIRVLMRYLGHPVGWAKIQNKDRKAVISSKRLRHALDGDIARDLIWTIIENCSCDRPHDIASLKPISIVVCTRDRADQLEQCLGSLLAVDYVEYEIIVVDNAPSNDRTARLVASLPARYVREDRPGLDRARNRGLTEARFEIVAFTDDDVRPDKRWLRAINAAFADPEVMAVTGLIAPAELETSSQMLFELEYGGMAQGLKRKSYERNRLTDREMLWASNFGAGANMAFRRKVFTAIGPFDVALDVGTPTSGGGDLEIFHRLLARGYKLVYDPKAIVWHVHRRSMTALRHQLLGNGLGFGSYLITCARNKTVRTVRIIDFALREWLYWWLLRRLIKPERLPRHLVFIELLGAIQSPMAYRKAQRGY